MAAELKKGIGIGIALGYFVFPRIASFLSNVPLIGQFMTLLIAAICVYFLFFAK